MNFEPRYSGLAAVLALVLLSGCSAGNGDFGRARDSLRLEADLPLYGHDLDTETTPIMAALGFAVASKRRREEANFPGAARILIERENGPVARRVGLMVEGRQPVREGAIARQPAPAAA